MGRIWTSSICTVPYAHRSQYLKRHQDWFSRFRRTHDCDRPTNRQTDHAPPSIAIGCIYSVLRYGLINIIRSGCMHSESLHEAKQLEEICQQQTAQLRRRKSIRLDEVKIAIIVTVSDSIGSLVIGALDLRHDGREFDSQPPRVIVFGRHFTKPRRPTQPPTLRETGYEYRPKCGDALWLGSKSMYGSFHVDKRVGVCVISH